MKIVKRALVLTSVVIAILLVLLFAPLLLPSSISTIPQRIAANRFYTHLATGELDEAFQYVHYFDRYSDMPPEMSPADARAIWKKRVATQQEDGIYLIALKNLDLWLDDMYPRGTAIVEMSVDGVHLETKHDIHFEGDGLFRTKIQGVRTAPKSFGLDATFNQYNKAISGDMRKEAGNR